ncbi:MAG: Crp/Fnr family transcriptional regulator [Myxococcota bacterium]|nr:Crp/Fnr family transcriptional regulator [Myxococcota bacterium]MEC9391850.1 Crp/Fnr family transcriptional regulator [Myxococcota bacterium]
MRIQTSESILESLRDVPLFAGLEPNALAALADAASMSELDDGQVLFSEGEMANELTFVVSGSIRLTCQSTDGVEVVVGYVQAGDILGEMAVLDPAPRSASARAAEPASVLHLSSERFAQFIDEGHPVAKVMLIAIRQMMTHRIRVLNERIGALFLMDAEEDETEDSPSIAVRLRGIWSTMRSGG